MAAPSESSGAAQMDSTQFVNAFEECVARRDYPAAAAMCRQRLKEKPDDRYALALRETVEKFIDAADELELDAEDEELPPPLDEIIDKAHDACGKAFDALFEYCQNGDNVWMIGEQAVGMFWDVGQNAPCGERRDKLLDMSKRLTQALLKRLKAARKSGNGEDRSKMPAHAVAATMGSLDSGEWLFEGLGDAWWCLELGLPCEDWLIEGCREELRKAGGSMQTLVGFSAAQLKDVRRDEMCDVLTQTWTLERSLICNILGSDADLPPLEYGIEQVLAEIGSRPLIEPPLEGFFHDFYVMTHVVYVLNCFNGYLPSRNADCPWVFSYLERCLGFWLREARAGRDGLAEFLADQSLLNECFDAIAEAADCLRGVADKESLSESDLVRESMHWMLRQQDSDGFFYPPIEKSKRRPTDNYNTVHPTWVGVAALQLDREVSHERVSPRSKAWALHARAAAQKVNFAKAPPPMAPKSLGDSD
eukprot:TRINITY_DN23037_c0_g1_i1.p1 TRINITY_DN23037_c0_g1~~TRINITY_DN23037_c0_g1_i1.p1  ORF type:complete len:508 (+),score=84.77 TRINITY_DN23037_c0_g1_i1:99-1526(+)